jgi:hypothetical protein
MIQASQRSDPRAVDDRGGAPGELPPAGSCVGTGWTSRLRLDGAGAWRRGRSGRGRRGRGGRRGRRRSSGNRSRSRDTSLGGGQAAAAEVEEVVVAVRSARRRAPRPRCRRAQAWVPWRSVRDPVARRAGQRPGQGVAVDLAGGRVGRVSTTASRGTRAAGRRAGATAGRCRVVVAVGSTGDGDSRRGAWLPAAVVRTAARGAGDAGQAEEGGRRARRARCGGRRPSPGRRRGRRRAAPRGR